MKIVGRGDSAEEALKSFKMQYEYKFEDVRKFYVLKIIRPLEFGRQYSRRTKKNEWVISITVEEQI